MIDSTNPRQLADNIRKLWDKFKSISGDLLPSRSTATTGQILKLTGENKTPSWADEYTPPAYSTTETATGQKWINGKDIYSIVIEGNTPDSETTSISIPLSFADIICIDSYAILAEQIRNFAGTIAVYANRDGTEIVISRASSASYQDKPFYMIVKYTKPDPVPETREDNTPEEPEEKKTTKKKTK